MAGAVDAVINSLIKGKIPLCQDGFPLEPLDYLALLFPNKGPNVTAKDVCFVIERFQVPFLRKLLPDATDYFTPDDIIDSAACFILLCFIITVTMIVMKYVWERMDPRFASITPSHKRWYVVANISKAFLLGTITLSHRFWYGTYRMTFIDHFQVVEVKRCGVIYVATDAVALYMVPKLPRSTVIHHISSVTLVAIVTTMKLDMKGWDGLLGVCKMSVLYALFSTLAFSVNAYLAFRVVYPKAAWLKLFAKVSLWTYILCCACNWSVHAIWMVSLISAYQFSAYNFLYGLCLVHIIHDDIVLIKWLINKNSPMAVDEK